MASDGPKSTREISTPMASASATPTSKPGDTA
jgi:hypothetical protein